MIKAPIENADTRTGLYAAASAYGLWGFLPLYFKLLGHAEPTMILAHRIVWAMPTVLVLVALAGKLRDMIAAIVQPRIVFALLASGIAIAGNWTIYIWAVTHNHVLEGSLGYFINPLITFVFAALLFGERFNRLQVAALVTATLGVINQAVVVGRFPWVSLSLAVSFAIYGAIRKKTPVDSRVGFAIETLWLAPFAGAYLVFLLPPGVAAFGQGRLQDVALFMAAGPVTAVPLILFALGARKLKLSTIAILQYIAPTLQFAIGIASGEAFTARHAVTFGLIWTAVALFTLSAWQAERRAIAVPVD
jgi:chloramphenicol-sensitive protein RarD